MQFAGGSALCLPTRDSFAGVLDDMRAGRNDLCGEYTPAMNPRRANHHPEPRILRIDFGFIGAVWSSSGLEVGFDPMGPFLYFGRLRLEQVCVVQERSSHLGVRSTERLFEEG